MSADTEMSKSPETWEAFLDDLENNITKSTHTVINQLLVFADVHSQTHTF